MLTLEPPWSNISQDSYGNNGINFSKPWIQLERIEKAEYTWNQEWISPQLKPVIQKVEKTKVGIITVKYIGDEGGLEPTNISGKHDTTSVWGIC